MRKKIFILFILPFLALTSCAEEFKEISEEEYKNELNSIHYTSYSLYTVDVTYSYERYVIEEGTTDITPTNIDGTATFNWNAKTKEFVTGDAIPEKINNFNDGGLAYYTTVTARSVSTEPSGDDADMVYITLYKNSSNLRMVADLLDEYKELGWEYITDVTFSLKTGFLTKTSMLIHTITENDDETLRTVHLNYQIDLKWTKK